MAPIACILVYDFPLAALVRANPAVRDNPFAISRGQGPRVIDSGHEREFLSWMPLDLLEMDDTTALKLERWGLRRLGDVARLEPREIGSRLGAAGVELVRLARGGERAAPMVPRPHTQLFV